MPAMLMVHERDPREALKDKIGPVDDFELFNNQVLCAVYIRPEKTRGGIMLPDSTRDEDKNQGKVGLVLKVGENAFKDSSGKWTWPQDIGVGDWVYFRASDGWAITLNGQKDNLCRILDDVDIRGRIQHPDQVW